MHCLSKIGVDSQQGTFLYFQQPLAGDQIVGIHDLKNRSLDLNIFLIDQQKGRNKVILLFSIEMTFKKAAVIDVHQRLLIVFLIKPGDYIGLVDNFAWVEVGRK